MSNVLTGDRVWKADTVGILSTTDVYIRKILMIPNAAGDVADFVFWKSTNDTVSAGAGTGLTGTISTSNTLTSTGNIPSDIAAGYVFEILASSGAAANVGKHLVATAGDANAVVVTPADWTDESSKVYTWKTIKTYQGPYIKALASDTSPVMLDFGRDCFRVPNLALKTLTSNAVIYIYLNRY